MSAEIVRFPNAKPAVRLAVDNTPSDAADRERLFRQELQQTRDYLFAALRHVDIELFDLCEPQNGIRDAIPAIKAALFHALTLAGCREADRELRYMLAAGGEEEDGQDARR